MCLARLRDATKVFFSEDRKSKNNKSKLKLDRIFSASFSGRFAVTSFYRLNNFAGRQLSSTKLLCQLTTPVSRSFHTSTVKLDCISIYNYSERACVA